MLRGLFCFVNKEVVGFVKVEFFCKKGLFLDFCVDLGR